MLGAMGWLNTEPEFENSKFQLLSPGKNIILGQGISLPNKYICEGKTAASRIAHNVINENGFGDARVFFCAARKTFRPLSRGHPLLSFHHTPCKTRTLTSACPRRLRGGV